MKLEEVAVIPSRTCFPISVKEAPDCPTDSEESMDYTQDEASVVPLVDIA